MFAGPIFTREAVVAPRRPRLFAMRVVYGTALLILISTAWMIIAGTQVVRNLSDMARFGEILFQILVPLQMALLMFLSAIQAASNVSVEKDRQTLVLLLMTRMTNSELVLGKLFSALLSVGSLLLTSAPILMLIVLFGGTSFHQVGWSLVVTLTTCLLAGSLGTMIGFWREKTFQSLALVLLVIAMWLGFWEGIGRLNFGLAGLTAARWSQIMSPISAILSASRPSVVECWQDDVLPYMIASLTLSAVIVAIAILRVRIWNPNREARPRQQEAEFSDVNIYGEVQEVVAHRASPQAAALVGPRKSRPVWSNPILWREMMTWAYGKKIVFIRVAYWLAAFAVAAALYWAVSSGAATRATRATTMSVSVVAQPLAPLMLVSLVILTALAVTSITTERDGKAIDLLMVTDLTPREFLFGKLLGVLYLGTDLILLPLLMCGYLWWNGALSTENLLFVVLGMLVLNVFVATLGIHCGMSYASTRTAISVSLGTVFFLFLGVVTCMVMLVSFTGNVEAQLAPFLACIVGGAVGLYVALGWQSPSPALAVASMILPFAMFYSITSLLLGHYASVIIVVAFTYGFATTAMLVPRLSEFRVSTGRSKSGEGE